jgi:hypothetical protein
MPFLRSLCGECSNNINIIKWLEYLPLGVTYHQVIEPHIIDLVGNNSFSLTYMIILLAYWQGLTTGGLPTFVDVGNSFGAPAIVEDNFINE